MKMAVQGSDSFSDYNIFMRAMRTALSTMDKDDKVFELYSIGPFRVNEMAREFSNVSEDGFRGRGMKNFCHKRPASWLKENMSEIDYFAFFKKPGESFSAMVDLADSLGVEAQVYEFK